MVVLLKIHSHLFQKNFEVSMSNLQLLNRGNKVLLAAGAMANEIQYLVLGCVNYDRVTVAKDLDDLKSVLLELKRENVKPESNIYLLLDSATRQMVEQAYGDTTIEERFPEMLATNAHLCNRIVIVEKYEIPQCSYSPVRISHLVIDVSKIYETLTLPLKSIDF